MRVTNISFYAISQPKSQVSFGLVENEENTRRVLPKNSDYRLKFADQFQYLKKHDAITVTSHGNRAWAFINKGFEKMLYKTLNDENFDKPSYLVELEDQEQFDSFYHRLESIDDYRENEESSKTVTPSRSAGRASAGSSSSDDDWTSFDEALWRR